MDYRDNRQRWAESHQVVHFYAGQWCTFTPALTYRRTKPPARPQLDPFVGIIDRILEEDGERPKKQRHTSKRIFERLRDEHGFTGGMTIVKDYVFAARQRQREMFVPLSHEPGHAQVDFGEAIAIIAGQQRKIHFFAMDLPHSDACFVKAYPAETTEAFCDGHVSAFAFFGRVPLSILYDNTRIAVARILGDGRQAAAAREREPLTTVKPLWDQALTTEDPWKERAANRARS